MLPSYFNYTFVHLRQKVRLRPESSPKFLSTLGLNPARTRTQGRREPRMGPGTTQILRISCFVQSKTCKENGTLFSVSPKLKRLFCSNSGDLQKKRSSPKLKRFFCPNSGDLKKIKQKKEGLWGFISMGPMKPIGPSRGPLQAHGPPKDHGPPKIHGPWGHCPTLPPSRMSCPNPIRKARPDLQLWYAKTQFIPKKLAKLCEYVLHRSYINSKNFLIFPSSKSLRSRKRAILPVVSHYCVISS